MREQLNDNPVFQLGVVAVLIVAAGFFLISTMGGGGEEEAPAGEVSATVNGVEATGATPGEAVEGAIDSLEEGATPAEAGAAPVPDVKLPAKVYDAWRGGATVVLLFVRDGGIDDDLVKLTASGLESLSEVTEFVVPAAQISRYSAVTGGVGVERVPALVVLTPRSVAKGTPTASVHYGFQSSASVTQAVIDAGYDGPTLDYHP